MFLTKGDRSRQGHVQGDEWVGLLGPVSPPLGSEGSGQMKPRSRPDLTICDDTVESLVGGRCGLV